MKEGVEKKGGWKSLPFYTRVTYRIIPLPKYPRLPSPSEGSSESWASLRTPTTGGSDAKTNKDLRTDQEAISHHGTVLLFRKNAQSCYQPGRCQS